MCIKVRSVNGSAIRLARTAVRPVGHSDTLSGDFTWKSPQMHDKTSPTVEVTYS